ncbi:MAG: AraC family transcriptional regulator [Candidatus Howiella sp.]|jgi:AraC-like DNA-binding protein
MLIVQPPEPVPQSWSLDFTPGIKTRQILAYVRSIGVYSVDSSYYTEREKFNTYLVLYTIRGAGRLLYNNREYILNPGDAVLIDCNRFHRYAADTGGHWEFQWLHFNGVNAGAVESVMENGVRYADPEIKKILDDLFSISKEQPPNHDIYSSIKLHALVSQFMLLSRRAGDAKTELPALVTNAVALIEENYAQKITLNDLCKKLNISKFYFCRVFHQHMQCSPYEYLLNYRITQAKRLLRTTDASMDVIAEKVGFGTSSHFIKTFVQREKVTPYKFRLYNVGDKSN